MYIISDKRISGFRIVYIVHLKNGLFLNIKLLNVFGAKLDRIFVQKFTATENVLPHYTEVDFILIKNPPMIKIIDLMMKKKT